MRSCFHLNQYVQAKGQTVRLFSTGVIPELVAKWIAGNGILPSMLCLVQEEEDTNTSRVDAGEQVSQDKKPEQQNPIVSKCLASHLTHQGFNCKPY